MLNRIGFLLIFIQSISSFSSICSRSSYRSLSTCISAKMTSPNITCEENDNGNTLTSYEKLLSRLYTTNLFNEKNDGLNVMNRLHDAIGSPMDLSSNDVSIIHIAGSNGKGSTSLKIAHALKLANYRVGLFSSPHISSFRERIQINEVPVSESRIEKGLTEIFNICDTQNIPATFFEVVTSLAFMIFAQEKVDIVVLETGLGGRLDATNIIKQPVLSVITTIGLEHTAILGDTVEKIALEKGGIIKEGCPLLVGKNVPVDVLRECAKEKKASRFYECDDVLGKEESQDDTTTSFVDYDAENSRISTAALTILQNIWKEDGSSKQISSELINEGVKVMPSCRFEEVNINNSLTNNTSVTVILDVAHNPQALEYLIAKLHTNYPSLPLRIIVGFSADKDVQSCSNILLKNVSHPSKIHLVESPNPRAAAISSILKANPTLKECHYNECNNGKDASSISHQVNEALKLAADNDELLVICGSFFIMADARKELGIEEPRDSENIGKETARIMEKNKKK